MSENNKPEVKKFYKILLPIVAFGLGVLGGFLIHDLQSENEQREKKTFVASSTYNPSDALDEISNDQDLPIVAPILWRNSYTLAYDGRSRNPFWVQEVLTKESIEEPADKGKSTFREDPQLPSHIRAHPDDYKKTGFVRGNMVSVTASKSNPITREESSLMSNTCPQCPHLIRGYWADLEKSIKLQAQTSDEVKVITGPLYLPQQDEDGKRFVKYQLIGDNDVAVPTHFFRVISSRKGEKIDTQAYIIPNIPVPRIRPWKNSKSALNKSSWHPEYSF